MLIGQNDGRHPPRPRPHTTAWSLYAISHRNSRELVDEGAWRTWWVEKACWLNFFLACKVGRARARFIHLMRSVLNVVKRNSSYSITIVGDLAHSIRVDSIFDLVVK